MKLSLSDDQQAIMDAIEVFARPYVDTPTDARGFVLYSEDLDRDLSEGGFLDVAFDEDLGLTSAALVVERLSRLAYAVEASASAFIRPLLGDELPRPVCLVDARRPTAPVRFLKPGATVVMLTDDGVCSFVADETDVKGVEESLYAYPVALLTEADRSDRLTKHAVGPGEFVARWRLALAAEIPGLLRGAIDSAVQYVSERKQFGRPLAAFQAVRHRLAEAHSRTECARWMGLKAAGTGCPADAAMAAHYSQEISKQIVYDLHQFLGAMGVTLEHPLHWWTYRIKSLTSELGGSLAQARDAAILKWDLAG